MNEIKAAFAVVPTDKICGWSLSSKIPVDMNSIFMNRQMPGKFQYNIKYLKNTY
jgi:hypothetical protein